MEQNGLDSISTDSSESLPLELECERVGQQDDILLPFLATYDENY